jgi:hypothetical protein
VLAQASARIFGFGTAVFRRLRPADAGNISPADAPVRSGGKINKTLLSLTPRI